MKNKLIARIVVKLFSVIALVGVVISFAGMLLNIAADEACVKIIHPKTWKELGL